MDIRAPEQQYNPYRIFSREQWARLRDDTPMTLEPGEFERLRSMHDRLDMNEVEEIFLPLSRLLSIYVDATLRLYQAQRQFLGIRDRKMPYIIGVAGSVAVGKSTTARVLQALLAREDPIGIILLIWCPDIHASSPVSRAYAPPFLQAPTSMCAAPVRLRHRQA